MLDVCLVILCEKIIGSSWDKGKQARANFAMGTFALALAATIKVVTYW